jgi:GNAT superfamily N-acetyltransferase
MQTPSMIPSIASIDATIGREAAAHLDLLWRSLMTHHGAVATERYFRLVTGEPHPLGNLAILRTTDDASVVDEAIGPLLDLPAPAFVISLTQQDDAMVERLAAQGLMQIPPLPAMAVDLSSLRTTQLPDGCDFFRVSTPEDAPAWGDALAEGFPLPRGLARRLSPETQAVDIAADAPVQFFGIRSSGSVVSIAMLYMANGLAGIYSVATVPSARRRGLAAHVTAEALRVARGLGYGVGVLQASPEAHGIYSSLGFREVGSAQLFVRMPG